MVGSCCFGPSSNAGDKGPFLSEDVSDGEFIGHVYVGGASSSDNDGNVGLLLALVTLLLVFVMLEALLVLSLALLSALSERGPSLGAKERSNGFGSKSKSLRVWRCWIDGRSLVEVVDEVVVEAMTSSWEKWRPLT
jgi:hypothetical protein